MTSYASKFASFGRRKPIKLTPVREIPAYAVIIRAIHERGATQDEAVAELYRRGLWLTTDQRRQAGLSDHTLWSKPNYPGAPVRMQQFAWGDPVTELGDVRVQHYGNDTYCVAAFLPGRDICVEGDTPKTEPEKSEWVPTKERADKLFDKFVADAIADGWQKLEIG